jgi:hypothetical protein
MNDVSKPLLCSECFVDQGLKLNACAVGFSDDSECPHCGSGNGKKLSNHAILELAHRFFVRGTIHRFEYGAAPAVQLNTAQSTCISAPPWLKADLAVLKEVAKIGFFHYGPRLWMVGEVEPLKSLQATGERQAVISRIIHEYPARRLGTEELFYRLRRDPADPSRTTEYDSPPKGAAGRLDDVGFPVMYGSQDLQICVHECRVSAEDETYVATLAASKELRLLDLTGVLKEEGVTEFESLDLAIHMLFLAGTHSYEISRAIAREAKKNGFDGMIYPSYFSLLRTGGTPFDTIYGISVRRFPQLAGNVTAQIVPNLAIFGRPIEEGNVIVRSVNKVILKKVEYELIFGPVGYQ